MLNDREIQLIKILVNSQKITTTDKLAMFLNVSTRTVKSDIKNINIKLSQNNISITAKQNIGVWINIPKDKEGWLYGFLNSSKEINSKDKSIKKYEIANYMINFNRYVYIDELCENLFYGRSTIAKELNDVESLLSDYNLKLLRNNLGLFIEGKEKELRFAQIAFLKKLNKKKLEDITNTKNVSYSELLNNAFYKDIDIQEIYAIILKVEEQFNIHFNDNELLNVYYYLIVTITRNRKSLNRRNYIDLIIECDDLIYWISRRFIELISCSFGIEYTDQEITYLYWYLQGQLALPQNNEKKIYENKKTLEEIINCLREIDEEHSLQLQYNTTLIENLQRHLELAVNRSKYQIAVENPLLNELKRTFAYAFEISVIFANKLEKALKVSFSDNEIGLFTMYIAAAMEKKSENNRIFNIAIICTVGKGIAEFLKVRIESMFNSIRVTDVFTTSRIDKALIIDKVDFILSTVPLENNGLLTVYISPILSDHDLNNIAGVLKYLQEKQKDSHFNMFELFDDNISFFKVDSKNKEEILKKMCKKLINEKYAALNIYDSLMKRESISSTALGRLIAIPHPFSDVIIKGGISIAVLNKPIQWDNEKVQIIFLLCISVNEYKNLSRIMENIFHISRNTELVFKLKDCNNLQEFINLINKYNVIAK